MEVDYDFRPNLAPRLQSFFSCSVLLSMEFQFLIKLNTEKEIFFLALIHSNVVFIMLINVKIPAIVGSLTYMSMINFMFN